MRLVTHTLRAALAAPGLLLLALLLAASAAPSAQSISLPVTFEESINYELTDFGGNATANGTITSTLVADPTDATNTVVQTVRGETVECFAGTTVAETSGFTERIPFTADETTMSVRVWSPEPGIRVLFKVEEVGVPTVNVETYSFTTAANAWETLVFDFADPKPNTNPISIGANYNKASIFFDFQCGDLTGAAPATRTYYWDDIQFGSSTGDGGRLVINEIDADTPGSDTAEFVELYNAGSEAVTLDGHVVVFFNGSDDASYAAFDLTGTLAAGDYYVLGNPGVPNVDQTFDPGSFGALQNGADAVALYVGAATDFPEDTPATTANLLDAAAYDTNDDDDAGLLAALGLSVQFNEDANGDKDNQSIQRSPDGDDTVVVALATPGAANAIITEPETFTALLRGENEVPAVETDAKGGVTAVLDGTTLTVSGVFAGLESDYNAAVGSHIHSGAASENGGVVLALMPTLDADNRGGVWEASNNTFTVRETFADSIRAGLAYVNVHSTDIASGEIRGQLGTGTDALPFFLSGASEVPPVETDATGSGTVTLDGSMLTLTGSFSGLESDYNAAVGSHIHGGAASENGGVVVALSPTLDGDNRGGTWEASNNTFEVRTTFADSVRAGLAYVNVHSVGDASGEVRGQIGTPAPVMVITLAEARAAGVDAVVTVEGVVSRAMGDFTYIQDDTAGLTIRQTSGAFADAVAAGTIAAGDSLRITGTLSAFANLLQIDGGDLADFEVIGTGDAPAPQQVTLAELAANGEDYEGELVTVRAVTIDPDGDDDGTDPDGTFQAGSNYQITDDSDATNAVELRVPNADDTSVDGTTIPAQANITAVVGQFDFNDSTVGYQLLAIDAGDIANSVATDGTAEAELSLAVANPVRLGATVRFALDAPGRARVALYDALGRQVATLADREVGPGEQTARLDAAALASGVYVLRLEAEGGVIARTITVVR